MNYAQLSYRCKCACCKYETMFDMPYDTALHAAAMHIQLDGVHEVSIEHRDVEGIITLINKVAKSNLGAIE